MTTSRSAIVLATFGLSILFVAQIAHAQAPSKELYLHLADQADASLRHDDLDRWFPAAVDETGGGFLENFSEDWTPRPSSSRDIVYQSRLIWLSAQAARLYPNESEKYLKISRHGLDFLAQRQSDADVGGLYWSVDAAGHSLSNGVESKHTYGIAFSIYAAAANYEISHDPAALDLAKKTFQWLDQHAHDAKDGGYFEALDRQGQVVDPARVQGTDVIGTAFGRKSMNTHVHVLEALVQLYKVWPDQTVHDRLQEVFDICLGKIYADPGYLTMFFRPDWQRASDRDSFGHDIEGAYLLVDAAQVLDKDRLQQAWIDGQKLVDHALQNGYDKDHGGFYNEGSPAGGHLDTNKDWWVEAEGLNALLLMHEHFGDQSPQYWNAFQQQWKFIFDHQIDSANGGWIREVHADGSKAAGQNKSDRWTEGYHQGRALMNVAATLRRLAENAK